MPPRRRASRGSSSACRTDTSTIVGERGLAVSAGERQRIALARAFLADPAVLVLDEPTAALDAIAQRQVIDGYQAVMRGRTTILITHRRELAMAADHVVVLDGARVVDAGRPARPGRTVGGVCAPVRDRPSRRGVEGDDRRRACAVARDRQRRARGASAYRRRGRRRRHRRAGRRARRLCRSPRSRHGGDRRHSREGADAEIFAIKVFDRELAATGQALVAACEQAVDVRAHIVNLSLGHVKTRSRSRRSPMSLRAAHEPRRDRDRGGRAGRRRAGCRDRLPGCGRCSSIGPCRGDVCKIDRLNARARRFAPPDFRGRFPACRRRAI